MTGHAVVIPTVGRPTLAAALWSLAGDRDTLPDEVVIVNDRPTKPLYVLVPPVIRDRTRVVPGPGRGPAAARNAGWRATSASWVVFVDDDVVPAPGWPEALARDLAAAADDVAGVQGRIEVPLPADRPPTDWERQVAGLATAPWITADMAYRRDVLEKVGGFEERFPRAYREDTDLALRVLAAGYALVSGTRVATHPVRPAGPWVSLSRQRGNADDALLRRRYGPGWRRLAGAPRGRRPWHAATTACGLVALGGAAAALAPRGLAAVLGRGGPTANSRGGVTTASSRSRGHRLAAGAAAVAGLAWLGLTAEFAARRIAPGPRTAAEAAAMVATSAAIPPVATAHWLAGWFAHRDVARVDVPSSGGDS